MLAGIPPSRRKVAMPVYVESVTQPSPQDLTDLAKIYADAPDWLLAPYSSADTLIAAALADGSLIAGRFNDRLLGAALLQRGGQQREQQLAHGQRIAHRRERK